ncbi:MAG: biopolymer transport protein ExbB [Candidatus Atribacteria bacterium]|uniref:MotA/TolQ/ExbB proton channel family protein n=1 Tax=Thermatribacter velox TaxID=3039681 RepID=A0ABZ2YH27_9BACT|nr:biopolymer transport protein ExbB [Candidatus Atribacteria bacterium]
MQIFSIVTKGGYIMYPILVCSVIFLAVTIERWYVLRSTREKHRRFFKSIRKSLIQRDLSSLVDLSQKNPCIASKIILSGLKRYFAGYPREAREAMETAALQELPYLEKRLNTLVTIANISPLLGLLGTVTGMIKTFNIISAVGVGRPAEMASGISEALITTAAGLSVAIPTIIAHHYLSNTAESLMNEIERVSGEILEIIEEEAGLLPGTVSSREKLQKEDHNVSVSTNEEKIETRS